MDNENKNIFTPSSAASLDRLRERRNTASTGDDTGGEAVSAAQSGPENGQSRIPKILKPEARAAQRAESGEAPNETDPAASDAVRQTVQNGVAENRHAHRSRLHRVRLGGSCPAISGRLRPAVHDSR